MQVRENTRFSRDYLDPQRRAIANAIQVFYRDGTASERIEQYYPLGHRARREEGIPLLLDKFRRNIATRLAPRCCEAILALCSDPGHLESTPVDAFMDLWAV